MKALKRLKEKIQPAIAWLALKNAQIQAKAAKGRIKAWWVMLKADDQIYFNYIILKLSLLISIISFVVIVRVFANS